MDDDTRNEIEKITGRPVPHDRRLDSTWPARFLVNLQRCDGIVKYAAALTGINERTIWKKAQRDEQFRDAFNRTRKLADRAYVDKLEHAIRDRALHGTAEPIYQGGQLVGARRIYDNRLSIRVLETLNPETWAPDTGFGDGQHVIRFTLNLGDTDRPLNPTTDDTIEATLIEDDDDPPQETTPRELNP